MQLTQSYMWTPFVHRRMAPHALAPTWRLQTPSRLLPMGPPPPTLVCTLSRSRPAANNLGSWLFCTSRGFVSSGPCLHCPEPLTHLGAFLHSASPLSLRLNDSCAPAFSVTSISLARHTRSAISLARCATPAFSLARHGTLRFGWRGAGSGARDGAGLGAGGPGMRRGRFVPCMYPDSFE